MRWLTAATTLAFTLHVDAVTIYTTFTTDANGNAVKPSNTNTATGPAYTGFGGTVTTSFQGHLTRKKSLFSSI